MTLNMQRSRGRNNAERTRMTSSAIARLAIVMAFVCSLAAWSWGQGAQGTIVGTVKDATGAVVANASVIVTNTETNVVQPTKTTQAGDFTVPFVKPGVYRVGVEVSGFEKAEVKDITVQVGQIARADVTLKPGASTETVSVSANPVSVDTDSSSIGEVITERQVLDLPMQDRSFGSLLLLAPGATTTVTNDPSGIGTVMKGETTDVAGARASSNGFLLDGLTNTEPYYTQPIVQMSLDAIQEFKEQSSQYSAQYGGTAALINVSSKSGTNDLHGALFEFIRNDAFDALSAFTPKNSPVPPLRQNDYGFAVGGPVYIPKLYNGRNHTFFFANFERLKSTSSSVGYGVAPTSDELKGTVPSATPIIDPSTGLAFPQDASGNYIIPQTEWSRLALVATKTPGDYFPIAGSTTSTGSNFAIVSSSPNTNNQQTYKIDQTIGARDSLSARFSLTSNPAGLSAANLYGGENLTISSQSFNVIENHTFSPSLVNQARVGWVNYSDVTAGIPAPTADLSALGLQNTFPEAGLSFPFIQFNNGQFTSSGGTYNVPNSWDFAIWNGEDTITWTRGKHDISFGALIYVDNGLTNPVQNQLGSFTFGGSYTTPTGLTPTIGNAWADFLLGDILQGAMSVPTPYGLAHPSAPPWTLNQNKYAPYVQDDWKIGNRLTLNLGLRYDFQGYPQEQQAIWALSTTPGGVLCTTSQAVISSGVGGSFYKYCNQSAPKKPFAPRVGFSARPFSNDKTVVRGGYGIFFDQTSIYEYDSSVNYPWVETLNPGGINFNEVAPALSPTVTSSDLGGLDHPQPVDSKDPYLQEWSLGVERELAKNTLLDVTYVGSVGNHLETRLAANQPYGYNADDTPAERAARYPFYNFGTYGLNGTPFSPSYVLSGDFIGASNYNALQASLNHRAKDLALLASFTWSSSMDDTSSSGGAGVEAHGWQGPMDAHDLHLDYSKSSYDVNKRLVTSFVYDLPFGRGKHFAPTVNRGVDTLIGGWQVNGIYSVQGGIPMNTNASDIAFALEAYGQRGNVVGNPYPSGFHKSGNAWYNAAAYAQPSIGTFGDEKRNDLRAPGLNNLDFSLFKNFNIEDRMHVQFRAEGFNALNHTQLGAPDNGVGDPRMGVINSVQIPGRIVQLGLKVKF